MKKAILTSIVAAMCSLSGFQDPAASTERELLAMEHASMNGWLKGDSGPALTASDPGITLFHVMTQQRVEGVVAVKELYAPYAGRPLFDSYQIGNPKVQAGGDMAILSYILVTHNGDATTKYNATQVYQRKNAGWKVIHTHFSATAAAPQ